MPEPEVRRRYFVAMREAVVTLWGSEGVAVVADALPADVRAKTIDVPVVKEEWLPATAAMAWFEAVWSTCAQRQPKAFASFIERQMALGFGRVRSFLLSHATPELLLARAPTLWRDDNTGGVLTVVETGPSTATLDLRDHVYVTTPLSRLAITELIRAIAAQTRVKSVTARNVVTPDGALRIHLTWTR